MSNGAMAEMPRYRCHKIVHALKIAEVQDPALPDHVSDGHMIIVPSDEGYASFTVDAVYVAKHNPQAGGYYIVYADGYKSWSPAETFESGYTRMASGTESEP